MAMHMTPTYDVAVLGAGLAGSLIGALLARQGVSVALIDPGTHPRFAIGESTIPHTSLLLSLLALEYDVPEIDHLAYPDRIAAYVTSTCGIKRAFGFAYHTPGHPFEPAHGLQFGTSSKDENHFFRQDIDAFVFYTAVRYGADAYLSTRARSVHIDRQGVRVDLEDGTPIRSRYVVDAGGYRSLLARQFDLRRDPPPLRHHARTLFTHMIGVRPFTPPGHPFTLSWHENTLHH
ncbi:MAG: FAD-dependent oxidoreductase, partial [Bacteroidetes bacterium]